MAFDKTIDSTLLDGALKLTADAIREKIGVNESISWDISRGFADAVRLIESGGLPEGWAMGQFNTTAETMVGNFPVEHGLGAMPNVVLIFGDQPHSSGTVRGCVKFNLIEFYDEDYEAEYGEDYAYYPELAARRVFADSSTSITSTAGTQEFEDGRKYFTVPKHTSAMYYPATTYTWIAIRLGL